MKLVVKFSLAIYTLLLLQACGDMTVPADKDRIKELSPNDSFLLAKHSPPEHAALPFSPSPFADRISLTWQGEELNELTITWRTDTSLKKLELHYTENASGADFRNDFQKVKADYVDVEGISYTSRYHSARIGDLKSGENYVYRIAGENYESEWNSYDCPDESSDSFKFIYMGDAQNDLYDTWARVMRSAYQKCPEAAFVLHAGDLINHADNDYEWAEFFAATMPFSNSIPLIATPGNHEYVKDIEGEKISFSKYWEPQFNFPNNGPKGFTDQAYYRDFQNVRIISLNSNRDIEAQSDWLDKVLSENPKTWSIVTFHHPVYSGSKGRYNEGVNIHWKPILDKHRVDMVLQGHDHTYARGTNFSANRADDESIQGTLYVVSVSGRKQYPLEVQPWMDRYGENLQLYQLIEVGDKNISFQAFTANNELYDEVLIEKVLNGPNRISSRFKN